MKLKTIIQDKETFFPDFDFGVFESKKIFLLIFKKLEANYLQNIVEDLKTHNPFDLEIENDFFIFKYKGIAFAVDVNQYDNIMDIYKPLFKI